jgi:hypothetical protein
MQTKTFKLFWSPQGKEIAVVQAPDASAAKRKAPKPYRAFLGEIYADELLVTKCCRIFRVQWWSDGRCFVTSQINNALIGIWDRGEWYGALSGGLEVPDDVRALAMECKPATPDNSVHLLTTDCKSTACGVDTQAAGGSDADINFVTCERCIEEHDRATPLVTQPQTDHGV